MTRADEQARQFLLKQAEAEIAAEAVKLAWQHLIRHSLDALETERYRTTSSYMQLGKGISWEQAEADARRRVQAEAERLTRNRNL